MHPSVTVEPNKIGGLPSFHADGTNGQITVNTTPSTSIAVFIVSEVDYTQLPMKPANLFHTNFPNAGYSNYGFRHEITGDDNMERLYFGNDEPGFNGTMYVFFNYNTNASSALNYPRVSFYQYNSEDNTFLVREDGRVKIFQNLSISAPTLLGDNFSFFVGLGSTSDRRIKANMPEMLVFNKGLNIEDLSKVEGYLSWQYNLQDRLPWYHDYALGFGNASFAEFFVSKLDLSTMPDAQSLAQAGDYEGAMDSWKTAVINRLRSMRFGLIGPKENHIYVTAPVWQNTARFLTGEISDNQYLYHAYEVTPSNSSGSSISAPFLDIYGIAGDPNSDDPIDWLAKLSNSSYENNGTNASKVAYGNLYPLIIPLMCRYWATGEDKYGDKYRNIMVDFCLNQKKLMESIIESDRPSLNSPWIPPYYGGLFTADRTEYIMKSLAVFAKSQEHTPPINTGNAEYLRNPWLNVMNPVGEVTGPVALISAEDLAIISLSLALEHTTGLYNSFINGGIFNQRVTGLSSLMLISCVFYELPGIQELISGQSRTNLQQGFTNLLNGGIFNDGGFIEHAFNYNIGTAIKLADTFDTVDSAGLQGFEEIASLLQSKILLFDKMIESLRTPFLEVPIVGNLSSNPTDIWTSQEKRDAWFASKDASNVYAYNPPKDVGTKNFTSVAFPYSGYYVQRKNWEWGSPYLFFINSRPIGSAREIANSLSIELHSYGRQMLVNGGPPPYDVVYVREEQKADFDKINAYFGEKSTFKSNTIIVNDKSQSKYKASVPSTAYQNVIEDRWHVSNEFHYMEGTYNYGYGKWRDETDSQRVLAVSHNRRIIFLAELNCWIVVDVIKNSGPTADFSQIWKFPPYGQGLYPASGDTMCYGFDDEQVLLLTTHLGGELSGISTSDPNGPNLHIYRFSNIANLSCVKYYGEKNKSTGAAYRGWYARGLGDAMPAVDAYVNWSGTGDFVITSLLFPTETDATPAINVNHIEHFEDPTKSSFEMSFGTKTVRFSASSSQQTLSCGGISGYCELLLTIEDGGLTKGLVINSSQLTLESTPISGTAGDFLFDSNGLIINKTDTIKKAETFEWASSNGSITPSIFVSSSPSSSSSSI